MCFPNVRQTQILHLRESATGYYDYGYGGYKYGYYASKAGMKGGYYGYGGTKGGYYGGYYDCKSWPARVESA